MQAVAGTYLFDAGKVYNLEASEFIKDHGDVKNQAVAFTFHAAVMAAAP